MRVPNSGTSKVRHSAEPWSRSCAYALVCSSETSATIMPGRNCRRMDNHCYGLRGKIINNPTDGSSRLARWANRLPAFTDLGTTDFFRIINGGTGNSEAQISGITVTPWQRSRHRCRNARVYARASLKSHGRLLANCDSLRARAANRLERRARRTTPWRDCALQQGPRPEAR
jgi:hypothetical protein